MSYILEVYMELGKVEGVSLPKMDSRTSHPHEKLIGTFDHNSVTVELVEWADTIWCGKYLKK